MTDFRIPSRRRRFLGQRTWVNRFTGLRKETRENSTSVKREQGMLATRTFRKTRMAWSKLDCLKSNSDRLISRPIAIG